MKIIKRLAKPVILGICVAVLVFAFMNYQGTRSVVRYDEHKQDIAVTIDGEDITFQDMAFYILYEERVVEEQARIYNHDSTKDYWNMHTNDAFIQDEAKNAIIGMAIHDRLLYQLAVAEGLDEFTPEEELQFEYAKTDFWEDLLDVQWTKLPAEVDIINEQIRIAAVAEKYQNYLAETQGPSVAAYKYDGYYYKKIEYNHSIKVNGKLWEKFVVGDITLVHDKISYVNGLTDEEKKAVKE